MGSQVTQCNKEVFDTSDIVVLAVKPNMVRRILREVYPSVTKDHLVISLAAGISIDTLQQVHVLPTMHCAKYTYRMYKKVMSVDGYLGWSHFETVWEAVI